MLGEADVTFSWAVQESLDRSQRLERVRARNRIAKRQSRARQREVQNQSAQGQDATEAGDYAPDQTASASPEHTTSKSSRRKQVSRQSSAGSSGSDFMDDSAYCMPTPGSSYDTYDDSALHFDFVHSPLGDDADMFHTPGLDGYTEDASICSLYPNMYGPTTTWDPNMPFQEPTFSEVQTPLSIGADSSQSFASNNSATNSSMLHIAVANGSKAIVQTLLAAGADVNALNQSGCAPLELAIRNQDEDMVDLLISLGANIS
ncbi:hypothetical protein BJ170DRAFT_593564 [Xylariales sp. AK1849]|nr:hypothetical protein BJ170DRAFT_593564 [Xylariales sp. AK1849]